MIAISMLVMAVRPTPIPTPITVVPAGKRVQTTMEHQPVLVEIVRRPAAVASKTATITLPMVVRLISITISTTVVVAVLSAIVRMALRSATRGPVRSRPVIQGLPTATETLQMAARRTPIQIPITAGVARTNATQAVVRLLATVGHAVSVALRGTPTVMEMQGMAVRSPSQAT